MPGKKPSQEVLWTELPLELLFKIVSFMDAQTVSSFRCSSRFTLATITHQAIHIPKLLHPAFLTTYHHAKETYLIQVLYSNSMDVTSLALTPSHLEALILSHYNFLLSLLLRSFVPRYTPTWDSLVRCAIRIDNFEALRLLYPSDMNDFYFQASNVNVEPHIQEAIALDRAPMARWLLQYICGPSLAYFLYEVMYESYKRTKVMEAFVPIYFSQKESVYCLEKTFLKAIWNGDLGLVRSLLETHKVDVNLDHWNRGSPLYVAILGYGGKDMVKLLLSHGASVTRKPYLKYACDMEDLDMVELLLRAGVNPNLQLDTVEAALSRGSVALLSLYTQYGLDKNLLSDNQVVTKLGLKRPLSFP